MTDDIWDDIPRGGGSYFKFESPGDSVKGTLTRKGRGSDFDGNPCPEFDLELEDGSTVTISAGQAMLKRLCLEQAPGVGDTVAIVYTKDERTPKGGAMKCFELAVKPGASDGVAADDPEPALSAKTATSAADLL